MKKRKFASFLPPKPDRSLGGDSLPSAWNRSSTTPKKAVPLVDLADEDVELSEKQDLFFELISQGQSVFITGAAGTGRTCAVMNICTVRVFILALHDPGKSYVLKILQGLSCRCHMTSLTAYDACYAVYLAVYH